MSPGFGKIWHFVLALIASSGIAGCSAVTPSDVEDEVEASCDGPGESGVDYVLPPVAEPEFTLTAAELSSEYAADPAATKQKYNLKAIRVAGQVVEVAKDELGVPYVVLAGAEDSPPVSVGFPVAREAFVMAIKPGQQVTLQGTLASYLSDDEEISLYDGGIVEY